MPSLWPSYRPLGSERLVLNIKDRIRRWLFPDLHRVWREGEDTISVGRLIELKEEVETLQATVDRYEKIVGEFVDAYEDAIELGGIDESEINVDADIAVFNGSIGNSTITMKPQIHEKITLAETKFSSLFRLVGKQQTLTSIRATTENVSKEVNLEDLIRGE